MIEVLKQMVEALENDYIVEWPAMNRPKKVEEKRQETIQAGKQAIAELESQEPVAWYDSVSGWTDFHSFKPTRKPSSPSAEWLPLYATPPQRKPLTDEQVEKIIKANMSFQMNLAGIRQDFEAAHSIKE